MESKKLIIFIVSAVIILVAWEKIFPTEAPAVANIENSAQQTSNSTAVVRNTSGLVDATTNNIPTSLTGNDVHVKTDVMEATISTLGGDIQKIKLLKYKDSVNQDDLYHIVENSQQRTLTTQTGLVSNDSSLSALLPNHKSMFTAESTDYQINNDSHKTTVVLHYTNPSLQVTKKITFLQDSYLINIEYEIVSLNKNLNDVSAYWRFVRDQQSSTSDSKFVHTFTGAIAYNKETTAHKIKFDTIIKANGNPIEDIPSTTTNGWAGFVEHYFSAIWLLGTNDSASICSNNVVCQFNFNQLSNNLVTAGFITQLPTITANTRYKVHMDLFAGPDQYQLFKKIDPSLERIKDYGAVYIFATPLFWLLIHIFDFVHNWGWSIILLTVFVKILFYPLTATSFRSMAKLKALTPKITMLKEKYSHDKPALQKEIMQLYRHEKVNPVGGCLPMILQIPVFIGLYWALLCSVELRQASFLWVHDLSKPDPYFILPVLMGLSMFVQTFFNPPSADPVQAKVMKIMPVMFSVMFFFFPSGLVLYWIANNSLSITQQWHINRSLKKHQHQK